MTKKVQRPVILFDGVCNLCVGSVQFFLKHDRKGVLKFAALQSKFGEEQRKLLGIPEKVDSLILINEDKVHYYSSAALRGASLMGGVWPIFKILLILPPFIRNGVYKWIAKNRYRWFGTKETCWLPTPELKNRFIEN